MLTPLPGRYAPPPVPPPNPRPKPRAAARSDACAGPGPRSSARAASLRRDRRETRQGARRSPAPPRMSVMAGIFGCASGLGTSFGGSGVSVGGFSTGTVIFSWPGSSAFLGGSGDCSRRLRRRHPGPGTFSQTISFGSRSPAPPRRRWRQVRDDEQNRRNPPTCETAEARKLPPYRPLSPALWEHRPRGNAHSDSRVAPVFRTCARRYSGTDVIVAEAVRHARCNNGASAARSIRPELRGSALLLRPRLRTRTVLARVGLSYPVGKVNSVGARRDRAPHATSRLHRPTWRARRGGPRRARRDAEILRRAARAHRRSCRTDAMLPATWPAASPSPADSGLPATIGPMPGRTSAIAAST